MSTKDENQGLLAAINSSGFPLQLAVVKSVSDSTPNHGWRVSHQEHSWENQDGEHGFIDAVFRDMNGFMSLLVEFKRIRQDIDAKPLAFLCEEKDKSHLARCFLARSKNNEIRNFQWVDFAIAPLTYQSMFCIVKDSGNQRTMIERSSAELVAACEAFAGQELSVGMKNSTFDELYATAIVTNAPLKICRYDPNDLSVESGEIGTYDFEEVPYVRFRKQLNPKIEIPENAHIENEINMRLLRENTVFVINAAYINEFLAKFKLDRTHHQNFRYLQP